MVMTVTVYVSEQYWVGQKVLFEFFCMMIWENTNKLFGLPSIWTWEENSKGVGLFALALRLAAASSFRQTFPKWSSHSLIHKRGSASQGLTITSLEVGVGWSSIHLIPCHVTLGKLFKLLLKFSVSVKYALYG